MNPAITKASEVAAMGPFRTQPGMVITNAKGFFVDHEELNILSAGFLAAMEQLRRARLLRRMR